MSAVSPSARRRQRSGALAVVLLLAGVACPRAARALTACTAADIVAQDSGCPGSGACTITKAFTVGNGCTLDFGSRDVSVASSGKLDVGSNTMTILAGSLTVLPGGMILGQGTGATPPSSVGGMITIQTIGDTNVEKSGFPTGRIDVSGRSLGGTLDISVGGTITIDGIVDASQLTNATTAGGGTIQLTACEDVKTLADGQILATGGYLSFGGGEIDISADGEVDLQGSMDVGGSDGGDICIGSGTDVKLSGANANAVTKSDGGGGGSVDIYAGTSIQILKPLNLNGTNSSTGSGGGCGGFVCLESQYGDVTISDKILAQGGAFDGFGGEIDVTAQGSITIDSGATVSAGSSSQGCGGSVCMTAAIDLTTNDLVDVSAGLGGGDILLCATRNMTLNGNVDASGNHDTGYGGTIELDAGSGASGDLLIGGTVDSGGGGCLLGDCGAGGCADVSGCNVTITATGAMLSNGPDAGQQSITAREQITVAGTINASKSGGADFTDGENDLTYPSRKAPLITGTVLPAPISTALDTCSSPSQANCLNPCPTCGDGVVQYPETCDNNTGTPLSCDGCDIFCQVESCDDGNPLTTDSCNPTLGCLNQLPIEPCFLTPSPTPTTATTPTSPTITPTVTPTPTSTSTPTTTPTPTETPTPTNTPTPTETPTITDTPTSSPTPSITSTANIFHDSVVLPVRPITAVLSGGQAAITKRLRVKVRNADLGENAGHEVQLIVSDGDCPAGTVGTLPDFNPKIPGTQDSIVIRGGKIKAANLFLAISRDNFTSLNRKSPHRCTLLARVQSLVPGSADPSPSNDEAPIELSVIDQNDPDQTTLHESAIDSVRPVSLRIGRRKTTSSKMVAFKIRNADVIDGPAGHAIDVTASDGDCPAGTVGVPNFAGVSTTTVVPGGAARRGRVTVTVTTAAFTSRNVKSPVRCTAVLTATGPSGDTDATNNTSKLVIDVATRHN